MATADHVCLRHGYHLGLYCPSCDAEGAERGGLTVAERKNTCPDCHKPMVLCRCMGGE